MRGWHYISGNDTSDIAVMESNDEKMILIRECEYDPATSKPIKKTTRLEIVKSGSTVNRST